MNEHEETHRENGIVNTKSSKYIKEMRLFVLYSRLYQILMISQIV